MIAQAPNSPFTAEAGSPSGESGSGTTKPSGETESRYRQEAKAIGAIAWEIEAAQDRSRGGSLGPGDVAELRRLRPEGALGPAFWRIVQKHLEPAGLLSGERSNLQQEDLWVVILSGMARTPSLHNPGSPLGKSLAEAGVSELRLLRLLQARGDSLFKQVATLAGLLASKGQSFNWVELARLVLHQDSPDWTYRDDARKLRRKVARNYYQSVFAGE